MIQKIFKITYSILIIFFILSLILKNKLPEKKLINQDLYQAPIQTKTERQDFDFTYRGEGYNVKPIADYELWGLVVSVNNINAWYNYYHDKNTVNLKDVCVVWGSNIENESYLDPKTKFKNGEWTCYVEWWDEKGKINMSELSNNHLLTADENIQKIIRDINVGDQIHLRGSLVDYAHSASPWYRKTSISRTDSNQSSRSGGACEIVYVDEINILQKNQPFWHLAKYWSKNILISLLLINIVTFFSSIFHKKSLFKENKRTEN